MHAHIHVYSTQGTQTHTHNTMDIYIYIYIIIYIHRYITLGHDERHCGVINGNMGRPTNKGLTI